LFLLIFCGFIVKGFAVDRRKVVDVLSSIKYIPEIIVEEEVYVHVRRPLSKRDLRKKRIREHNRETTAPSVDITEVDERRTSTAGSNGLSIKILSWVARTVSSRSREVSRLNDDIEMANSGITGVKEEDYQSTEQSGNSSMNQKSKRFLSADRQQRFEARKLLIKSKSVEEKEDIEEEEDLEEQDQVVSLLTIAEAQKSKIGEILEGRKDRRVAWKENQNGVGSHNVVALNAGPPQNLIPHGYKLVSQELGPNLLLPEVLVYKRILYLWEGKERKEKGWFLGTIVGTSDMREYNYRVKYDREETKTIFVDGIDPVMLTLHGENAYGRRWVALEKIDPKAKFRKNI